jgi:hypothetical protein
MKVSVVSARATCQAMFESELENISIMSLMVIISIIEMISRVMQYAFSNRVPDQNRDQDRKRSSQCLNRVKT